MSILDRFSDYLRDRTLAWLTSGRPPMFPDTAETKKQKTILVAREYYSGDHNIRLTERQKAWLQAHEGADLEFTINECATVVDAVVERMYVTGLTFADEQVPGPAAQAVWSWWKQARLPSLQIETHRSMIRDGETFMIVDWNEEEDRPEFHLHPRFISEETGGDGYGVWVEYPNDDYNAKPERAVKQWIDHDDKGKPTHKRVLYYPDYIERQQLVGSEWTPREEDGKAPREDWPLGIIPVAHFRNPNLQSDLRPAIPLQDALNKAWLDLLAASDTTAWRMLVFRGWIPTKDGKEPNADLSNLIEVLPGQMIATRKTPAQAAVDDIPPADLTPLLQVEERIVVRLATVTDTPLSRFQTTRQVASGDTLKEQEAPLISKVGERILLATNGWQDTIGIALRMDRQFGRQKASASQAEAEVMIHWRSPEIRNDWELMQVSKAKKEMAIPLLQIWAEMGYTAEQIKTFTQSDEWKARLAGLALAVMNPSKFAGVGRTQQLQEEQRGGTSERGPEAAQEEEETEEE